MTRLSKEERTRMIEALSQAGELDLAAKLLGQSPWETLADLTGVQVRSLCLQATDGILSLGDRHVSLTGQQVELLAALASRGGKPVCRRELADHLNVWPGRIGPIVTKTRKALAKLTPHAREVIAYLPREKAYGLAREWPLLVIQ